MKKQWQLIKKDIWLQRKTLPSLFLLVAILMSYFPMPPIPGFPLNFQVIMATFILTSTTITTSMVYDDKNMVLTYMNGLPFLRREMVFSKYLLATLMTVFSALSMDLLFTLLRFFHVSFMHVYPAYPEDVFMASIMINLYFFFVLPLFFYFGYAKTQMFTVMVIMGMLAMALAFFHGSPLQNGNNTVLSHSMRASALTMNQLKVAFLISSVVLSFISYGLLAVSYGIGITLYRKREL
jgi:hypothetical protein